MNSDDLTLIFSTLNNHIEEFRDTSFVSLPAGDYEYRMCVNNKNRIPGFSYASITKS